MSNVFNLFPKWPRQAVLAEARRRTKGLSSPQRVQEMLETLMVESGWNPADFNEALCADVIRRGTH